jgi:hypothetical protein
MAFLAKNQAARVSIIVGYQTVQISSTFQTRPGYVFLFCSLLVGMFPILTFRRTCETTVTLSVLIPGIQNLDYCEIVRMRKRSEYELHSLTIYEDPPSLSMRDLLLLLLLLLMQVIMESLLALVIVNQQYQRWGVVFFPT